MSLSVGKVQLQEAHKELRLQWADTKSSWDDAASRSFEKDHLAPLDTRIKSAVAAMDSLGEIVWRARRECEQ